MKIDICNADLTLPELIRLNVTLIIIESQTYSTNEWKIIIFNYYNIQKLTRQKSNEGNKQNKFRKKTIFKFL